MPDKSDVEQALAGLIADLLYPDGFERASVTGDWFRIYRGWPVSGALERDVSQGVVHINVHAVPGATRDTTRFSSEWQGSCPATTVFATVGVESVSFDGTGGAGQVAGIKVDGRAYAYRLSEGDSVALVAAALAAQIRKDRPAVAVGNVVKLKRALGLTARVVTDGEGGRELRRQVDSFRITCWCPKPALRDQVVSLIDARLSDQTFLDVSGWACRLRYAGDSSTDDGAAAGIWRRDLTYSVEYPTVVFESLPAMLFGVADVNGVPFVG